ncbi:MAG: Carboxypeptidase T precursor [uncultured Pseudonocardia sp.]|uniref:Zinc carboxypeptidase n=1 Tax=uncultured Pseudonocardia sp. TaxID=211455 RepID=A0A6J4PBI0_9PSEU|nr:MAG: Carboxypeptidase T precursor [uncultured Pseudonocardia sp.]
MKRLVVLLASLLMVLGAVVGTATTAAAAPPGGTDGGGLAAYTGELTREQFALLLDSGLDRHEIASAPGGAEGTTRVEAVLGDRQAQALIAQGLPLEQRGAQARTFAAEPGVFRPWSGPGNLREEFLALAAANPGLVKTVVLGQSVNGQDILAFKVTRDANRVRDGRRPATLYVSTQHAREWITPEMTRRLMRYVLDGYGTDPELRRLVDTTEMWFVPVANPDGYDFTFTEGNRLWRKNLRDNNGDGQIAVGDGVDPNRNFPTRWGYDNEGSSPEPASETYRGPGPASEPETQALDGLMRRVGFEFFVNYHSAAELLLYGTGWQVATPTPDDVVYEALVGDDATPAVPGYDPDISAELYTTNGETTEHAHEAYGTLAFTPEMATCQSASAVDPEDAFEPADCESVFNFPDSEPLIQAEFEKNIPFALSVARSAADPDDPVSVTGRTTPDFVVDSFAVSYGDPQTVAVTARRAIRALDMRYRINGGREQRVRVSEWAGGERYGDDGDRWYGEFRGEVRGARAGDRVEVRFTGVKPGRGGGRVESEPFTYTVENVGGSVLVLSDEDYNGFNPGEPGQVTAPRYAQAHVDALAANGVSTAVWDVSARGVPHDLGVLSHFDAVVWYLGDNRLTQDAEDVLTQFGGSQLEDAAVSERQQYLTLAVRDYLNDGGKLALAGETAGYYGVLGSTIGGIYYGLDGAPEQDCAVTTALDDCLFVADDFTQYYLGAYSRSPRTGPTSFVGTGPPVEGLTAGLAGQPTNPIDEAGSFVPTSSVLPVEEFPQFASSASGQYVGAQPGFGEPVEGEWFANAVHADSSFMRLTRTVDLTAVTADQAPSLAFALAFDTESGYDNVIVEAKPVGAAGGTTLPEAGGLSSTTPPAECEAGFLLDLHPSLTQYLTPGTPCASTGTSGAWNAVTGTSNGWQDVAYDLSAYAGQQVELSISYVTDPFTGGAGVNVDATRIVVGGTATEPEGFETSLGAWTVPGAPAGSPANAGDFARAQAPDSPAGAAITTEDTVLLGFGLEQVPDAGERAALLGAIVRGLTGSGAAPAAPAAGPAPAPVVAPVAGG